MGEGNKANAQYGYSVASAGDVNGDGYSDVIVGAIGYSNPDISEGAAFVYHGSPSGLSTSPAWMVEGNNAGAVYGGSVASAGDVNGDGYSDVIVGAPQYTNSLTYEGAAYVYLGSSSGLSTTSAWLVYGNQLDASYGYSVASAGDVNGDGYSDVIVGAVLYDSVFNNEGAAYVYLGSSSGLSTTAAWVGLGNQADAWYGVSVASAGDVNGDGYSDVIVGVNGYTNGESYEGVAFLYLGSTSGLSTTPIWTGESNQPSSSYGVSVASAGDVNGDGYSDVIVGANKYDAGQLDEGAAYVYLGSASGLSTTSVWMSESNQNSAFFGYSVASAGDVNGDGYSDVIIGARDYDNGETAEGAAFLYLGSASGLSTTAAWMSESNQANAWYGTSVASAGDVNGDGYGDVIVGAYLYDNPDVDEGIAYVYLGSASGLSTTPTWKGEGNQLSAYYGRTVASAGDVNGDGYGDIIVGAYQYDNPETNEGAAFVYFGSASGLSSTPSWIADINQVNALFGYAVASAGDVNGDGYSDVIVGAYGYDKGLLSDVGAAYVYLGSSSGLSTTPFWIMEGAQQNSYFGSSVASAGDVNGDGYSDIIIGAYANDLLYINEGSAHMYYGSTSGPSTTADWVVWGNQDSAFYGRSVASAGDVNNDGYSDVIVGAYVYDNGQTNEGVAYLYLGSQSGPSTSPSWTAEGNQTSAYFGYSVASAGDVNGDGYSDVIVGAYKYDNPEADEGAVFLYYGNEGPGFSSPVLQIRSDRSAPIAPLGAAYNNEFRIEHFLRTPFGRGSVKLQWQALRLHGQYNLNPVQSSLSWLDSSISGLSTNQLIDVSSYDGPWIWRVRTLYRPSMAFPQPHGPWRTLAANNVHETNILSTTSAAPPPCFPPDEPIWIYQVTTSTDGNNYPILHFQDPNQPDQVTGYHIRRSDNSSLPKANWPLVATNITDMDAGTANIQWTDATGDVPPSGTWYYQVTAYNAQCGTEGPF